MLLVPCSFCLLSMLLGIPVLTSSLLALFLLIVYVVLGNQIYKTWYSNMSKLSFIANLCILALATCYIRSTGGSQNAVTFTSTSITFATFVGIVTCHSVQQIKHTPQLWRKLFPHYATYVLVPPTDEDSRS